MAYIDRELLLQDISNSVVFSVRGFDSPELRGARKIIDRILNAPTADVVEVKHSRWENISGFDVCNICGTSPAYCEPKPNNPQGYPRYCHNCGAKMDGGKEE